MELRAEKSDEVIGSSTEKHYLTEDAGDSRNATLRHDSHWLTTHVNNNNNSFESNQNGKDIADSATAQKWLCQSCEASTSGSASASATAAVSGYSSPPKGVLVIDARVGDMACSVEDEGGGGDADVKLRDEMLNGARDGSPLLEEGAVAAGYSCCTVSLSPPDKSHSNRTSINNSTENLSCCSDNLYGTDDIILLDDVDIDVEEVSLNSDDCVYAYRGDGADFDLNLAANAVHGGASASGCDDETDFLEMDFEPDPLSEVECGSAEAPPTQHLNDYLMQRNISNHVSGRHSANMGLCDGAVERQLFSSPTNDLPPPKALQAQSMLSKNLARISLHLDQIKGGESNECDRLDGRVREERQPLLSEGIKLAPSLAQSLPSTLNSTFTGEASDAQEPKLKSISPPNMTGAKPKRFSTSSSSSSKHSTKSRHSMRSVSLLPAFGGGSASFDERSVSCAEFRSVPPDVGFTNGFRSVGGGAGNDDYSSCDETCLDCLEKEFITSTVGQSPGSECPKCRKHSSTNSLYTRAKDFGRCRSDSPPFFGTDNFFDASDAHASFHKSGGWTTSKQPKPNTGNGYDEIGLRMQLTRKNSDYVDGNQRNMCDNFSGNLLLKTLTLTEPEIVTISTLNLAEEALVQALEKLHVPYSIELIQAHFSYSATSSQMNVATNCFKNLKKFLLLQSKKHCNHMKLKRLIELATGHSVRVQFKKDPIIIQQEMIPVQVNDILQQWSFNQDLNVLKKLDKRFQDANVLGKVVNIVRLSAQRGSSRRTMPDFITIPQYYPSGHLTLTKIC